LSSRLHSRILQNLNLLLTHDWIRQGYGWFGAPALYTEEHKDKWVPVVDALHAGGTVVFHQLWHMGRQSHPSYHASNRTVAASAVIVPGDGTARDSKNDSVPHVTPEALTLAEIAETVQDYKKSAELAKQAGFDGVEIHAANGN
jgi:N-ethylmaleimide reductase